MIKIGRLTDYGIVLMSYMASHRGRAHNAAEMAAEAHLPVPTVSKLLRELARGGLLASQRGVHGGYVLARDPQQISVAQIITALEGPIALTACSGGDADPDCEHESMCPVRGHWTRINRAIRTALEGVTLAEMASPPRPDFMTTTRLPAAAPARLTTAPQGT
jgi:FeS assembly SUF system regulator